jgi:hypothetical protein
MPRTFGRIKPTHFEQSTAFFNRAECSTARRRSYECRPAPAKAVSSQWRPNNSLPPATFLLLTPWDALVTQLEADVATRFWARINASAPTGKDLVRLYPSTTRRELDRHGGPAIWFATITTLQTLHANHVAEYEELHKRLGLVVVDEGHYEPARSWSDAVRGLQRPTVLFSATPYRNDVKYFELSDDFQFHFSHENAEKDHFLRRVKFEPIAFDTVPEFCGAVISAIDQHFGAGQAIKVIVRCDSQTEIDQMITELERRGQTALGIHERFTGNDGVRFKRVPNHDDHQQRYWVHQFKLTEGIDSAAFRAVAFFRPLPSERAFVQQVGRVLRNPARSASEYGLVIHRHGDDLDASWQAYREYDVAAANGLPSSPLEIANQQPPAQYFDRKFRSTFDIKADVDPNDLLFPRSVRVFRVPKVFDLDTFSESVEVNLDDNDCLHHRVIAPRSDSRIHPYLMINNSPILARSAFYQCSLGFTYYRRIGNYLFFLDSEGIHPDSLSDLKPADTTSLRRLFTGANIRLGSISLTNTTLGEFSARRRTLHARSIADLGPDLSDHAQVATTVTGTLQIADRSGTSKHVSRYVGFSRSRISDRGFVEFAEFNEWLEDLAKALDRRSTKPLRVFDRFAQTINRPNDPTPTNILLDFDPTEFQDTAVPDDFLRIDDLCIEAAGGRFSVTANDDAFDVTIKWDNKTGRYLLESPALDQRFSRPAMSSGPRAISIVRYLNREQSFRVIPNGGANLGYSSTPAAGSTGHGFHWDRRQTPTTPTC